MAKPKKKHPKRPIYWTEERWPTVNPNQPLKGESTPDNDPETTELVRAEILKRTAALSDARRTMGIPATRKLLKSGKMKPEITPEQSAKLHKLAFTSEQVRAEIEAR
jgi:hypothetical protein